MPPTPNICPQCGGVIPPGAPRCPYCGSAYAPEAEKEYMRKLHGVRGELGKVGDVGEEISRAEAGKLGRRIALIVGIILALAAAIAGILLLLRTREERAMRREFQWTREATPELNALFESGDYETLTERVRAAQDEGHSLYNWEHYDFCRIYEEAKFAAEYRKAWEEGYFPKENAEELLYHELQFFGISYRTEMSAADKKALEPYLAPFENDLELIYRATDADFAAFEKELEQYGGYTNLDFCSKYVEEHPEILTEPEEP